MHKTSVNYHRRHTAPAQRVALMGLAVCCQCPESFQAAPSPPCLLPAEQPKSSCHIQYHSVTILSHDSVVATPWTLKTQSLPCQSRVLGEQPRYCREVLMELQQSNQNPAKHECSLTWGKGDYQANRWNFHKFQFRALSLFLSLWK